MRRNEHDVASHLRQSRINRFETENNAPLIRSPVIVHKPVSIFYNKEDIPGLFFENTSDETRYRQFFRLVFLIGPFQHSSGSVLP